MNSQPQRESAATAGNGVLDTICTSLVHDMQHDARNYPGVDRAGVLLWVGECAKDRLVERVGDTIYDRGISFSHLLTRATLCTGELSNGKPWKGFWYRPGGKPITPFMTYKYLELITTRRGKDHYVVLVQGPALSPRPNHLFGRGKPATYCAEKQAMVPRWYEIELPAYFPKRIAVPEPDAAYVDVLL